MAVNKVNWSECFSRRATSGNIGEEGCINFHLRHAELHMSCLAEAASE